MGEPSKASCKGPHVRRAACCRLAFCLRAHPQARHPAQVSAPLGAGSGPAMHAGPPACRPDPGAGRRGGGRTDVLRDGVGPAACSPTAGRAPQWCCHPAWGAARLRANAPEQAGMSAGKGRAGAPAAAHAASTRARARLGTHTFLPFAVRGPLSHVLCTSRSAGTSPYKTCPSHDCTFPKA